MLVIPFDLSMHIHAVRIVVTEHALSGLPMERQAVLHTLGATFGSLYPARLDLRPFTGWLKEHLTIKIEQRFQRMIDASAVHV